MSAAFHACRNKETCSASGGGKCDCIGGAIVPSASVVTGSSVPWGLVENSSVYEPFKCGTAYQSGKPLCSLCANGYAKQINVCNECTNGEGAYIFFSFILIVVWFPLIRKVTTEWIKSTYTSFSFIQALGLFASLQVGWSGGISDFLSVLGFFNLNLYAVHLPCANFSFEDMWIIQGIVLPCLYPAFVLISLIFESIYANLCKKKACGTPMMISYGMLPRDAFTFHAIIETYAGAGLFYLNSYYYTGIETSLSMLICTDDSDGTSFLTAEPSLKCWEGSHTGYGVAAVILLIMYGVAYPLFVVYLLLKLVPKYGVTSDYASKICGFLFMRFQPKVWYWELVEFIRRSSLAYIMSLGTVISPVLQCVLAFIGVFSVMIFEVGTHPFRSPLYSALEEATSVAECLLLLFGILAITGGGDFISGGASGATTTSTDADEGDKVVDAANGLAWAVIIISLIAVLFVMATDVAFNSRFRLRKLRKEKGLVLSEGFFDLRIANGVLLDYIAQASADEIAKFHVLEKKLLKKLMSSELRSSVTTDNYQALLTTQPYLLELLVNAMVTKDDTSDDIKHVPFSELVEKLQSLESGHTNGPIPGAFLFTDIMIGPLIRWVVDLASYEEACLFKSVIDSVIAFHIQREASAGMMSVVASFLQSLTMLVDERARSIKAFAPRKVMAATEGSFKKGKEVEPASPASKQSALHEMKINRTSMTRAELAGTDDISGSAGMLQYLAKQVSCKTVLLASVKADGTISKDILSNDPEAVLSLDGFDACVQAKEPIGLEVHGASLIVPIKNGDVVVGVIHCLEKISPISDRTGVPFSKSDATVAEVCGGIALTHGGTSSKADLTYTAVNEIPSSIA
jgi:hypothetical protein